MSSGPSQLSAEAFLTGTKVGGFSYIESFSNSWNALLSSLEWKRVLSFLVSAPSLSQTLPGQGDLLHGMIELRGPSRYLGVGCGLSWMVFLRNDTVG